MARSLPNIPPGDIQEELSHAVDGTEQVRRLLRHRGHPHGAPQDGHPLPPPVRGIIKLRWSGGVCLHVMQCIILLITHKITRYPCSFVHTADHILRG